MKLSLFVNTCMLQTWETFQCHTSIQSDMTAHVYSLYQCVLVPVKVVDILDVAKQRAFILRAQSQARLISDTLQVILQREKWRTLKLIGSLFTSHTERML